MSGEALVVAEGVTKRFGPSTVPAVDRLAARIGPGKITGLVGPDAAGKTTLLRLVAGLLLPDSGRLTVCGADTRTGLAAIRRQVSYMPQRFGLYEDLSVLQNLNLYADLRGVVGAERQRAFDRLLAFTDLARFTGRLAGRLSGGMKQKLGLACALIRAPRLLLLDEPSAGVDPLSRRELWRMVGDLVAEGIGVVWSTAYLDEAERCAEVLLLNAGQVLYAGPPRGLTGRLEGRTFLVRGAGPGRRMALAAALQRPEVVDGVVQGRSIRLVLREGAQPPDPAALGVASAEVAATPPRFEDAFVDLLGGVPRAVGQAFQPAGRWQAGKPAPPEDAGQAFQPAGRWQAGNPAPPGDVGQAFQPAGRWQAGNPAPPEDVGQAFQPAGRGQAGNPAPPEDAAVVEAEALTKQFGDFTAVDRISFRIGRGEIFGLLGPNGAGKSTTFKMMIGLLRPTSGSARVAGHDLQRAAAAARARLGYMAQRFSLYGDLSVRHNLRFFAGVYGLKGDRRREATDRVASVLGLAPYLDRTAGELPPGLKQRLALACAVMHDPAVLFLDEPTSGVDPLTRREFWSHINALVERGVTVMVTTHFLDEAEYCDRVGLVYRGRLIAEGSPDDLEDRTRTADHPEPTLEDAFVALIEASDRQEAQP